MMSGFSITDSVIDDKDTDDNENNFSGPKIAIIGGGLTGLFTATLLERAFAQSLAQRENHANLPQITIFEKSRSVGRLATRYKANMDTQKKWQWAFGAQFFTAKSERFVQFIQPWLTTGVLQSWCATVVELTPDDNGIQLPEINQKEQWDTHHARYISTPKMTTWGRDLAHHLEFTRLQFKTRVASLRYSKAANSQTELVDDCGTSLGLFDWVISTVPNIQALELMANTGFSEYRKISQPKMQACYSLMLGWSFIEQLPETLTKTAQLPWDVAVVNNAILDKIFIEHHKPAHDDVLPSVTIHARNDWSETHVDDDIDAVKKVLLQAAQQALQWHNSTTPTQIDCHRWRYAATVDLDEALGILIDTDKQWIVSGDWCGNGNIESGYQMAEKAVQAIITASYA